MLSHLLLLVKIFAVITALLFSILFNLTNAAGEPWKLWKKDNFQSVSYRPTPAIIGASNGLIEIRATAKVNSNISGFLFFIQDVNNTPNWLVNTSESKILKEYSTNEHSFYITLDTIWPLKPRFILLHSTYKQNDDLSVEITLTDANAFTEEVNLLKRIITINDYIPVIMHNAQWKVTPLIELTDSGAKELFIEHIFIADGRGDTPKWLADHLALKSIWKSIRNIRRQLPKAKWQHHHIKGVTELTVMPTTPKTL
jgi:hypothetical protein